MVITSSPHLAIRLTLLLDGAQGSGFPVGAQSPERSPPPHCRAVTPPTVTVRRQCRSGSGGDGFQVVRRRVRRRSRVGVVEDTVIAQRGHGNVWPALRSPTVQRRRQP